MKNSLNDLNNHLFAQLERLGDESLNGEALQTEIARSNAITDVADSIISKADLQLRAAKLKADHVKFTERDVTPLLPTEVSTRRLDS